VSSSSDDVKGILRDFGEGDRRVADRLLPIVYQELHALASCYLRHQRPGHTLQPTAPVHEAYLRLVSQDQAVAGGGPASVDPAAGH
jgi:hypothetical protein